MVEKTVVWVHGDCLNPQGPALTAYPDAPTVWVWDEALLTEWQISLKRVVFIYECLLELPVTIMRGDVVKELVAFAHAHQAQKIAVAHSPSPKFEEIRQALEAEGLTVEVLEERPFVSLPQPPDLKRFSRYWRQAQKYAFNEDA